MLSISVPQRLRINLCSGGGVWYTLCLGSEHKLVSSEEFQKGAKTDLIDIVLDDNNSV